VKLVPMLTGITQLIEHPIQLKPPSEPNKPILLPIHLTKHEQRKLRRQKSSRSNERTTRKKFVWD